MTRLTVPTATPYEVCIGRGLLDSVGELLENWGDRVCVVTDENVAPLYAERVCAALSAVGVSTALSVLPSGEQTKQFEYYVNLIEQFSEAGLTRGDTVLALGGGVIGDLAGFAAATYLRGVRLVNVPTTLLAMVDASVGGKTGLDLPTGKNQVGAFWQPSLVVCDTAALETLPPRDRTNAWAEVIKMAILFDEPLFSALETGDFSTEEVIAACVRHKSTIIAVDEHEHSTRRLLNLGHTIAHAVECCGDFHIPHGEAVAIGLAGMARGFSSDCARILALLRRFGLPTETIYSPAALAEAARYDKKRHGDTITLILPERIGHCITIETPISMLESIFRLCLQDDKTTFF